MGRRDSFSRLGYEIAQPVVTQPAGPPQVVLGCDTISVTVRLNAASTGTLAGAFALQVTDFGVDELVQPPLATDWVTLASTSQTWAGVPLNLTLPSDIGPKFVRVLFTNAGSTGAPTVDMALSGNYLTDG